MPNRYLFQNLDSWFLILLLCIVPWEQSNNRNIHPPSGSHLSCDSGNIIFIFENYHISTFPVTQISGDDVQYFDIDIDIITNYNMLLHQQTVTLHSHCRYPIHGKSGDIYDITDPGVYQVFWGQRARWNRKNVVL